MKNFFILFTATLVSTLFFSFAPLFAQNAPAPAAPAGDAGKTKELKIYYSEPIGAGEKVHHITSCKKQTAYGPVRCSEENKAKFRQCEAVGKDGKKKTLTGNLIKGCILGENHGRFEDGTYWLTAQDVRNFEDKKCPDADKQAYLYGPEYAIVRTKNSQGQALDEKDYVIVTTLAWERGIGLPPSLVSKIEEGAQAKRFFRSGLCLQWDLVGDAKAEDHEEFKGELQRLFDEVKADGKSLSEKGCNNDNTGNVPDGVARSTPFNEVPSYTCSIVERISGRSGSELFGRYIAALYRWAASIVGIVAVLIMVASGIQISMAGGDSAKIDEAKNRIMQSLIGIVILFLSALILYTINPGFFTG